MASDVADGSIAFQWCLCFLAPLLVVEGVVEVVGGGGG